MSDKDLTRKEKDAINRAWGKFEDLTKRVGNQHYNLRSCLLHETTGRGRPYAKAVMLEEFWQGATSDPSLDVITSVAAWTSLGRLWARSLGASWMCFGTWDGYFARHRRDFDDLIESIPTAIAGIDRLRLAKTES